VNPEEYTMEELLSPLPDTPMSIAGLAGSLSDWRRARYEGGYDVSLLVDAIGALQRYAKLLKKQEDELR
jgi:hypothetical protein